METVGRIIEADFRTYKNEMNKVLSDRSCTHIFTADRNCSHVTLSDSDRGHRAPEPEVFTQSNGNIGGRLVIP